MINLVWGAPCSGKSYLVQNNFNWGDIVVDLDRLFSAISFLPVHEQPNNLLPFVLDAKEFLIQKIRAANPVGIAAWIISGCPKRRDRERFKDMGFNLIFVESSMNTCRVNLRKDPLRTKFVQQYDAVIEKWFKDYEA